MVSTVLIIEDEENIASLIKDRLDDMGYVTSVAYTGKEAAARLREKKPDLITLDIYLPDANGLSILKDLKKDPETDRIPVVIISSSNEEHDAMELGAVKFVNKPINFPKLFEVIEKVSDGAIKEQV